VGLGGDGSEVDPLDSGLLDWIWNGELEEQGYTHADLATLARILSRVCPHCGATIGAWCVNTGSGQVLDHIDRQHVSRRMRPGYRSDAG
jgi:hypothetical protein